MVQGERVISLPEPRLEGDMSLEAALRARRSVREYSADPLTLAEVSQLLWAAQGITHGRIMRTAPSAGALYPLEIYLLAARVDELEPGVYKYQIADHELLELGREDRRSELKAAALQQDCIGDAAAVFVIAGVVERTAAKYGQRAVRYVHIEVGAAAQNMCLQAASLGLGTAYVGAFNDTRVHQVVGMEDNEAAIALLPVGGNRER